MQKEQMTIHRALAELKLIDARIEKGIDAIVPSGVMQPEKLVNQFHKKDDFEKDAKSKYDSVTDLIDRKHKIKSAITQANSVTEVEIGDKKMTISEAINYKQVIGLRKRFAQTLKSKHALSKTQVEDGNAKVDENALRLAEAALNKDNVKIGDNDAVAITKPYIEANKFILVDPLDVDKKVEDMIKEIDEFEADVDAKLSEVNATTFIEI